MLEAVADAGIADLERRAAEAARFLRDLANEHRLMVLCRLAATDEMTVTAMSHAVGLGQSALSQHLSRLREEGVVSCRREAQTVFYRLSDARTRAVLGLLNELFCEEQRGSTGDKR
jgi:ArsR family transcriptional regulator